jgi:hypothetical protein
VRTRNSGSSARRETQARSSGGRPVKRSQTSPFGPRPNFGGVEHDAVVAAAAALLALDEADGVLADPADRQVVQPGDGLVLAGPADRLLRGVDVHHLGAGLRRDERGDAGIGEEVEDLERAPRRSDAVAHPLPVRDLLRKDADVAERGEAAEEADAVIGERPGLRDRLPVAPAAVGLLVADADEGGVGRVPVGRRPAWRPDRLLLRPHDPVAPVALKLPAVARIEEGIVVPAGGFEHDRGFRAQRRAASRRPRPPGRSGRAPAHRRIAPSCCPAPM